MPRYLYQAAYTSQSLAAQIKNPADRLQVVADQIRSTGVTLVAGAYTFGDYDIAIVMEAPDDVAMAAVAVAIAAGGAIKSAHTTRLLSGDEYVAALKKAGSVGYRPAGS